MRTGHITLGLTLWISVYSSAKYLLLCAQLYLTVTPWTVACQAPLSMKFPRHEYWWFSRLVTKLCPTPATPWTVACQVPLSLGFSRQEYCSGLSFPSPGALSDPGTEPRSPALQVNSLPSETPGNRFLHFSPNRWAAKSSLKVFHWLISL